MALGTAALLILGSAYSYAGAHSRFKTNTSESDIIEAEMGRGPSWIGAGAILVYNIVSIVVILVICTKLLAPEGSWFLQVATAVFLLACMTGFALTGIEMNKSITNATTYALIGVLVVAALLGFGGGIARPHAPGDFMNAVWMFLYVLVGFDAIMKFTEETAVEGDVPTAFFLSNGISILLTLGVAAAIASWLPQLTKDSEGNALGLLFATFLGKGVAGPFQWLVILFLLLTTFVVFLATSRYLYGLGEKTEFLSPLTAVNEAQAPWISIVTVFVVGSVLAMINHVETLVIITDVGFAVIAALVAGSMAISDWRDGFLTSAAMNGATASGFLGLITTAFLYRGAVRD
jgi:hypothetical protein